MCNCNSSSTEHKTWQTRQDSCVSFWMSHWSRWSPFLLEVPQVNCRCTQASQLTSDTTTFGLGSDVFQIMLTFSDSVMEVLGSSVGGFTNNLTIWSSLQEKQKRWKKNIFTLNILLLTLQQPFHLLTVLYHSQEFLSGSKI